MITREELANIVSEMTTGLATAVERRDDRWVAAIDRVAGELKRMNDLEEARQRPPSIGGFLNTMTTGGEYR